MIHQRNSFNVFSANNNVIIRTKKINKIKSPETYWSNFISIHKKSKQEKAI